MALAATLAFSEEPPAHTTRSVHCVVTMDLKKPASSSLYTIEVWSQGGRLRAERAKGETKTILLLSSQERSVRAYHNGAKNGTQMPLNSQTVLPSILFLLNPEEQVETLQKKGTLLGNETLNGVACLKYQLIEGAYKTTIWLSANRLPVKMISENQAGKATSTATANYSQFELNRDLPDKLFQPPADITFK